MANRIVGRGIYGRRRVHQRSQGRSAAQGSPWCLATRIKEVVGDRAALVALLRVRPEGLTVPEITSAVLEVGSAVAVWERHVLATLICGPEQEALEGATADMDLWESQRHTFLTILDEDYPIRLRGIHEAPPVPFANGAVQRHDLAVSVVGSREASERGLAIAQQDVPGRQP